MLAKLAAILQSKVALAAIGGALVIGGATAAAATGNLHIPGLTQEKPDNDNSHDQDGHHGHTVAINGTLKAYNAGAKTITVEGKMSDEDKNAGPDHDKTPTASKTPAAHETKTPAAHEIKTPAAHETKGPEVTKAPEKTPTTGTFTIVVNADTKVNGRADALADLTKAVGSHVQVQAQEDSKGNLTAWKVTVGSENDDHSGGHNSGNNDNQGQPRNAEGTVHVSAKTTFKDLPHGLADLKSGMRVRVQGTTQVDGSIAATEVAAEGQ